MKKFKLWIEGEPLQEEVWDRELNAPKTVDILFDEEPRKATNERFSTILFSEDEWKRLEQEIGTTLKGVDGYTKFLNNMTAKAGEKVDDLYTAADILGYGKFIHVDEDMPIFIDELDKYPYAICKGGDLRDAISCGEAFFDSDAYAIEKWDGSNWVWIWGDSYEEVEVNDIKDLLNDVEDYSAVEEIKAEISKSSVEENRDVDTNKNSRKNLIK